jgi:arylsulfatase
VIRWPEVVPANTTCPELATTMDLLPTLASVAGAENALPTDRTIDGVDLTPLLEAPETADTPRDHFAYFDSNGQFRAIRDDAGMKYYPTDDELYHLHEDVSERVDVSEENIAIVERLSDAASRIETDVRNNARPVGSEPGPAFTTRADD